MKATASRAQCVLRTLLLHAIACTALSSRDVTMVKDSIGKRDTNKTVIPEPISVAASQYWDGNDGPWSSFPLQIGTGNQVQNVRVMISTAGYDIWTVFADGCPTGVIEGCATDRGFLYYSNESTTWIANSAFDLGLEQNLGLDSSGDFGFDTVTLGWQGSGGPTIEHATIAEIATFDYWLGIFGLNPKSTNFTTLNDPQPSFMTQLYNQNMTPSISYGYTAGNQYRFDKVLGSLVLGGYDESKFEATNLTFPFGSDVSRDLLVGVQSITANNTKTALTEGSGSFYAFIDSTIPYMYLPIDVCQAFEAAFGLTWNSTLELYLVNDTLHTQLQEQAASVTFTLAPNTTSSTVEITLPYAAFDLQVSYPIVANQSYYFPLKQAANDTQYTLGRTFLQEAYLIVDYQRSNFTVAPCVWSQTATESIKTILAPGVSVGSSSKSSSFPAGAIAGVVVGIVALIAILALALFFLRRKKKTQKAKLAELDATEKAREVAAQEQRGEEGKPFIQKPAFGSELSGETNIHEMGSAAFKFDNGPQEMDSPHKMDPNKAGYNEMEGEGDADYFAGGKGNGRRYGAHEMAGDAPIYEMPGSDVHELPARSRKN